MPSTIIIREESLLFKLNDDSTWGERKHFFTEVETIKALEALIYSTKYLCDH